MCSAWSDGWYVVNDTVTVEGDITVNGNVHLLLTDGYKLTVTGNVSFASGNSLTVYGQEQGTGALTVEGGMANGSSSSQNGGNGGSGSTWTGGNGNIVTVSGGKVTVGGSIVNVGSGHTGGAGAAGTATGIIYKDNVGTVYGNNVTLQNDTEIPAGATLIVPAGVNRTVPAGVNFTIPAGASMTVNGMLNLGGTVTNSGTLALQSNEQLSGTGTLSGNGMWQILNITTDVISVPADRVYDGTDWTDDAKAAIALPTDAGTICGKAFTYNTDGWAYTLSPETVLNAETYTVTYSKTDFSDVTKTFEVKPAPLTVTAVLPETWWGEAPTIEDVAISGTLYSTDTVEVTGLTAAPQVQPTLVTVCPSTWMAQMPFTVVAAILTMI